MATFDPRKPHREWGSADPMTIPVRFQNGRFFDGHNNKELGGTIPEGNYVRPDVKEIDDAMRKHQFKSKREAIDQMESMQEKKVMEISETIISTPGRPTGKGIKIVHKNR